MASQYHVVRGGIVLRVIGVNVRVAKVNRHVVVRCCQPVFIGRLAGGSDFNRHILWSFYFSTDQTGTRKYSGEQQDQCSQGARRTYCGRSFLQSPKRPTERQICWPSHFDPSSSRKSSALCLD